MRVHLDDIVRHMHLLAGKLEAVIGCSVGGVLALRYGMLYPDQVEKIVAVAAPGIVSQEEAGPLWAQRVEEFRSGGKETLAVKTVRRWFPHDRREDDAVRGKALQQVKTCSFEGYRILADAIRDYDYSEEAEGLRAECLIVAGSEDGSVKLEVLKGLAGEIRKARFVMMEGAGHLPPMQKAREFEEIVLPFLED